MENLLVDALDALLADFCTPEAVRQAEQTGDVSVLWEQLRDSGFADALLSEERDGAGLTLQQSYPLLELCGTYAVPVPLAETMVARAALEHAGLDIPDGMVAMAMVDQSADNGDVLAYRVPYGRVAQWVLLDLQGDVRLLSADLAHKTESEMFPLDTDLQWTQAAWEQALRVSDSGPVRVLQACVVAAHLAGSLQSVFQKTLTYANEREQFGRPIGKFQVIQHQLSVLAEEVFSARMAATIGCCGTGWKPDAQRVAVAKARTSEAALSAAQISHSVHGAIGFTEEYDLQLYTRRLHHGRQTAGTESYWHDKAGALLLEQPDAMTLDVVRQLTDVA